MRTQEPRIAPLQYEELNEDQRILLDRYRNEDGVLNIYRTLARNRADRMIVATASKLAMPLINDKMIYKKMFYYFGGIRIPPSRRIVSPLR